MRPDGRPIGRGIYRRSVMPSAPHFLFRLAEKKTGRGRSKRKGRFFAALRCSGPPRGRGSPESVPAKTAGFLPARAGPLVFSGLGPRVRCGGHRGGHRMVPAFEPAAAHGPAKDLAAPSEAEGAEIEERQMRSRTHSLCRHSAAGTGEQV